MLAYPNWSVESFSYCPPTHWLPQTRYDEYSSQLTTCRLPIIVYNKSPIKCEEFYKRKLSPQQPLLAQQPGQFTQQSRPVLTEQPSPSPSEQIDCEWSHCDMAFGEVARLSAHVAREHSHAALDGLFYCRWRGCLRTHKGFNARYKMLVHVRTHTNEKPHVCSECNKSFSRAENLKIHKRSHSGERPYVCSVEGCEKAYSNSSDRFKHMRTHAVEKPYACKVTGCLKRYTDPSSLRKHVKAYKHYTENSQPAKSPHNSVIKHGNDTKNDRLQPLECSNNVYKAETKIFRPFSSDLEVPRKSCIQEITSYRNDSSDDSMSSSVECRKCSPEPSYVHNQTMTFSMNPYSIEPVYERIHPMEDSIEFQLLKNMELPLDLSTKS